MAVGSGSFDIGDTDNFHNQGQVRVFDFDGTNWIQKGTDLLGSGFDDQFGRAVALSSNGNNMVVGSPLSDATGSGSGRVDVFDFDGNDWVQRGSFIPSSTAND